MALKTLSVTDLYLNAVALMHQPFLVGLTEYHDPQK